jgi:hypothetical protein
MKGVQRTRECRARLIRRMTAVTTPTGHGR